MSNDFITGFATGYINTILFYPAFTIIHNKFRNNISSKNTFNNIYNKHSLKGFYSGLALFSFYVPLTRGGEMYFQKKCDNFSENKTFNIALGTFYSNIWRFGIYPINTLQINKQVLNKYKVSNIKSLWSGFTYNFFGGIVSNFSWFYTYNILNDGFDNNDVSKSTFAGMGASVVSDTVSHPFKVFKLLKQTDSKIYFNLNTAYRGFFLRLVVNGIQGGTYGFLWNRIDNFIKN